MRSREVLTLAVGMMTGTLGCSASHDVSQKNTADDSVEVAPTEAELSEDTLAQRSADWAARGARAGAESVATGRAGRATARDADESLGPMAMAMTMTNAMALEDIQFAMDTTIAAGTEALRCIYAQLPTDRGEIAVSHVESHYTPGSHHLLAYRSNLTSVPENYQGVWDCSDGLWQLNMRGSYYEAQMPDEEHVLPNGIAHKFQPGEVLIVQAHYLNPTERDLDAHIEMTLHPTDPAAVEQEAGTIFFNNINIQVPAFGTATSTMSCELPQDIQLALLWSHMHERGVSFVVTTDDPTAAEALGTLYEEDDWAEPVQRAFPNDATAVLHAGTHIQFSCTFHNESARTFTFGNSAHDNEMCILHGMYWPRMPLTFEQCLLGATRRQ